MLKLQFAQLVLRSDKKSKISTDLLLKTTWGGLEIKYSC